MIEPAYHFCPHDGEKLVVVEQQGTSRQKCEKCQRTLYVNQALTASAVISRDGKILVVRRAIDPFQGMLDLPGGYIEPTETARAGLLREVNEELHVQGKIIKAFDVLGPDPYPFEAATHYNADMLYQVDIGEGKPVAADDVASFTWLSYSELKPEDFAFPSHQQFIKGLQGGEYTLI